jgi:hypothetical protein
MGRAKYPEIDSVSEKDFWIFNDFAKKAGERIGSFSIFIEN